MLENKLINLKEAKLMKEHIRCDNNECKEFARHPICYVSDCFLNCGIYIRKRYERILNNL